MNNLILFFSLILLCASICLLAFLLINRKKNNLLIAQLHQLNQESMEHALELKIANTKLSESNEEIVQQQEEIRAQTDSLESSLIQLRELNEFKEGMTAMIVHDLRNPLNVILNYAKDKKVEGAGKQMLNLINNILDVHRFESLKMPVIKSLCKLSDLIENACKSTCYLMDQKSIQLFKTTVNYELNVDAGLIERIFINLLSNAIKYTPYGGKIEIGTEQLTPDEIKIYVSDNGPGIPENLKNRVFDKFEQIIAKKSGETRSYGLGLTFCKLAVEAHDGIIGIDTKVGKGTSFWFTLPLYKKTELNKIEQTEPTIMLSKPTIENKRLIQPFLDQLKLIEVYEVSKIQQVITSIENFKITEIQSWLKALENSIYTVNETEYKNLLVFFD